ncbi:alpha/beta-hydrolase [Dentipellis sp. KUC8613]|nr:alpha/beta-hydrolase [Dentipellis sp. KUC8613]
MLLTSALSGLLSTAVLAAGYRQQPLSKSSSKSAGAWNDAPHDEGLFKPVGSLSALSSSEYTTLSHPLFPKHSARIKKTNFCDTTVAAYTGYIDIEAKHIFFYFFESRNDPTKDDVMFWTNGGPGGSSALGLFMELGPCTVINATAIEYNPYSWNSNANIFFVDQPVSVGFSYAEYGEHVDTTEDAAQDIAAFVALFFENFSAFKGRAFHMAGESYGGRYVPLFASAIYDQNVQLAAAGLTSINLTSVMIGNGMTDRLVATTSYFDMSCTAASVPPVLDISTCVRMKKAIPRCEKWYTKSCLDQFDLMNCEAALNFCDNELSEPFAATGLNFYDISKPCEGVVEETFCYPITKDIAQFLNSTDLRSLLGVDPAAPPFATSSWQVNSAFTLSGDILRDSTDHIAALLERDVKVLIYVGDYDWICNWVGNERWTLALDWHGRDAFASQELRTWDVDGEPAGKTRSAQGFTFATVYGAGHMMLLKSALSGLLGFATLATAYRQQPLSKPGPKHAAWGGGSYDEGLFNPVESLGVLSTSEFTTLSHPLFPKYSARIKKSDFCDTTVAAYTGYIDIEAKHIFFYFFESRSDPAKDDVIFWTNGGPGCSSSLGLFMELGPCRVTNATTAEFHPESWNSNANIFFVDQPVGVGFSYAEYGEHVDTSEEAAQDIAAFVALFFENFPSFKGRAFHMAGESYGGRYVPLFASAVYDQNAALVAAGLTPINLTSAMIGNGLTDHLTSLISYFDMTCTPASVPPVLDISTCTRMKKAVPRCEKWVTKACIDQFDHMNCEAAAEFCSNEFFAPFTASGLNPYDISKPCDGAIADTLCYPVTKVISKYLDNTNVRSLLGVDPAVPQNFSSCSNTVATAFALAGDMLHDSTEYVAALLERDVKVLIYVGDYDWICNWVGNERWSLALDWSGKAAFSSQELRTWEVDGQVAGKTRAANGFTFATVHGAGHMVPYDKPKQALALVNRWLAGEPL